MDFDFETKNINTSANYADVTFHDASTQAGNGLIFPVGAYKNLRIEIFGSVGNTARTITFYGKSKSGVLKLLPGIKDSGDANFTMGTSTTNLGEVWSFEIVGWDFIIMDLTAITGGSVSVAGRVVT